MSEIPTVDPGAGGGRPGGRRGDRAARAVAGRRRLRGLRVPGRGGADLDADGDSYGDQHALADGDCGAGYAHRHPDRYSDGDSHQYTDQHLGGEQHPDKHSDGDTDRHPDGNRDRHADQYANQDADGHTDGDSYRHADTDRDGHADSHRDIDADRFADTHPYQHADFHGHVDTYGDADRDTNRDIFPHPDRYEHADADVELDADDHGDTHRDPYEDAYRDALEDAYGDTHRHPEPHPDGNDNGHPDGDPDTQAALRRGRCPNVPGRGCRSLERRGRRRYTVGRLRRDRDHGGRAVRRSICGAALGALLSVAPAAAQTFTSHRVIFDKQVPECGVATLTIDYHDSATPPLPITPDTVSWRAYRKGDDPKKVAPIATGGPIVPVASKVPITLPTAAHRVVGANATSTERHTVITLASKDGDMIPITVEYDVVADPALFVDENTGLCAFEAVP